VAGGSKFARTLMLRHMLEFSGSRLL